MLQCQVKLKYISYKLFYLEDRYFPHPLPVYSPAVLSSSYFHQQKRVNWFNKLSYKNKYISGLHYFFELAISTLSATLQAGDLIDQVDRERGANSNKSRGIQLIHAKRLTHHPNTRYTLLVRDSWKGSMLIYGEEVIANKLESWTQTWNGHNTVNVNSHRPIRHELNFLKCENPFFETEESCIY